MSAPLHTGKQPIRLAPDGTRISRIRRDPPPVAKKAVVPDREELDRRTVPIGIVAFTLAIVIAIIGLSSFPGWTPSQHTIHIGDPPPTAVPSDKPD